MLELRVHYLELIELSRWYHLFWVKIRMEWFDRGQFISRYCGMVILLIYHSSTYPYQTQFNKDTHLIK